MYIQVCTSYVPANFLGRTSSIPGRIKLYVSYIYMYIPGAHQLAQIPLGQLLLRMEHFHNASSWEAPNRWTSGQMIHMLSCWDVLETSCINMTWPEKESKEIQSQLTFNWLMLTCKSSFMQRPFYKEPEDHVQLKRSVESLLSQANLCGSIKNLRHRLLLASNGIGGNSLSALKTNEAAMELNCAELCWTVLNCALKQSPKP